MKKIYVKNNYLIIEYGILTFQRPSNSIIFVKKRDLEGTYELLCNDKKVPEELRISIWSDYVDENNTPFADEDEFLNFITLYTGNFNRGSISPESIVLVDSVEKFPTPVSGTISLDDGVTYIIIGNVDIEGNRIDSSDSVVNLFGLSSETSSLTSTGLGVGVPLITSNTTIKLRDITIQDVDTCLDLDKSAVMALDWDAVNFANIPNIGEIADCDNFIFNKGTFLNSQNFLFTGTIATIAISDSLLQGDGTAGSVINVTSTAVITRRFRIDKSAAVIFGSTIGISFNNSASVPVENYILDTVNFSGGGTYISGVNADDNKAYFKNNKGIKNSNEIVQFYANGNTAVTTITAVNTPVKVVLSSSTDSPLSQKFNVTGNRATYVGSITRVFKTTCSITLTSGNTNQVGVYIAKNGSIIAGSEMIVTTTGNGRVENVTVQSISELQTNDYIEIFISNNTATNNITVTDINLIVN